MWEPDFYYGFEPKEDPTQDDECIFECDFCGEEIKKGDSVMGIISPRGEKIVLHEGEDIRITELLDLLDIDYVVCEAEEAQEFFSLHGAARRRD